MRDYSAMELSYWFCFIVLVLGPVGRRLFIRSYRRCAYSGSAWELHPWMIDVPGSPTYETLISHKEFQSLSLMLCTPRGWLALVVINLRARSRTPRLVLCLFMVSSPNLLMGAKRPASCWLAEAICNFHLECTMVTGEQLFMPGWMV